MGAGIIDALAAHQTDQTVCTEVPWAMAGPSGADTTMRHYSHDAWNSISSTIKLPDRGACLGALAPVLTPSEPGERRSYTVVFPILPFSRADRQTASGEWAADMGEGLRGRLQIRQRSRDRANVNRAHRLDAVPCLPHHDHVRLVVHDHLEPGADHALVVRDDHPDPPPSFEQFSHTTIRNLER